MDSVVDRQMVRQTDINNQGIGLTYNLIFGFNERNPTQLKVYMTISDTN